MKLKLIFLPFFQYFTHWHFVLELSKANVFFLVFIAVFVLVLGWETSSLLFPAHPFPSMKQGMGQKKNLGWLKWGSDSF